MERKFDDETIRLIVAFENLTGVSVKDCVIDKDSNLVYMLIEDGKLGVAIGKGGRNIKSLESLVKRRIKLFEFSEEIDKFVRRLVPQANKVNLTGGVLEIYVDKLNRSIVIGRDGKNLNLLKTILRRNFKIEDVIIR